MIKKWLIVASALLFTTACQPQDDVSDPSAVEGQGGQYSAYNEPTATEVANHLAQLSIRVPEVNNATAIVIGPYALVGINVSGEIDQSEVGSIKYQVAEALASDPYGASAAVTADPDVIDRIKEMRVEMGQGRPIAAIMNELAAIIGRVIPVVPGREHRQSESEDPTNVNDDKIDGQQQGELKEIQDEQSKGRMSEKKKDRNEHPNGQE
ncbi:YhcN/YlaJ family sporulation lipoprotein [Evansella sp. AB-rgal1]|uniref:YhcN/YlaJ family sporulation lipoprotein n=1 Tax=Evansella sp. AB-rgal1 TaxID=3242696 RepID=UPI00359DF89D